MLKFKEKTLICIGYSFIMSPSSSSSWTSLYLSLYFAFHLILLPSISDRGIFPVTLVSTIEYYGIGSWSLESYQSFSTTVLRLIAKGSTWKGSLSLSNMSYRLSKRIWMFSLPIGTNATLIASPRPISL